MSRKDKVAKFGRPLSREEIRRVINKSEVNMSKRNKKDKFMSRMIKNMEIEPTPEELKEISKVSEDQSDANENQNMPEEYAPIQEIFTEKKHPANYNHEIRQKIAALRAQINLKTNKQFGYRSIGQELNIHPVKVRKICKDLKI